MFQIGAAAQVLDLHPGILAQQDPLQQTLIPSASRVLGGALAPVRVGTDLQRPRLRLSEAHYAKAQGAILPFRVEYPAHRIALLPTTNAECTCLRRRRNTLRCRIRTVIRHLQWPPPRARPPGIAAGP